MHDGSIAEGDTWLRHHLGRYVSWAPTHNSLLVLTWDEDDRSQHNRIFTLVVGAHVAPVATTNASTTTGCFARSRRWKAACRRPEHLRHAGDVRSGPIGQLPCASQTRRLRQGLVRGFREIDVRGQGMCGRLQTSPHGPPSGWFWWPGAAPAAGSAGGACCSAGEGQTSAARPPPRGDDTSAPCE